MQIIFQSCLSISEVINPSIYGPAEWVVGTSKPGAGWPLACSLPGRLTQGELTQLLAGFPVKSGSLFQEA